MEQSFIHWDLMWYDLHNVLSCGRTRTLSKVNVIPAFSGPSVTCSDVTVEGLSMQILEPNRGSATPGISKLARHLKAQRSTVSAHVSSWVPSPAGLFDDNVSLTSEPSVSQPLSRCEVPAHLC